MPGVLRGDVVLPELAWARRVVAEPGAGSGAHRKKLYATRVSLQALAENRITVC